jgi:hypothetical protein
MVKSAGRTWAFLLPCFCGSAAQPSEGGACATVGAAGGTWTSVHYQPSTGRAYIVGRVRITPRSIVVENDAVGRNGNHVHWGKR